MRFLFAYTILLTVLIAQPAISWATPEKETAACSAGGAEYLPHPSNPTAGEDHQLYSLHFKFNPKFPGTSSVIAFAILNILDSRTEKPITTLTMDYTFSGGSVGAHYFLVPNDNRKDISVIFLNRHLGLSHDTYPYSIIIPNAHSYFNYMNWEVVEPERLKFFTKDEIKPDFKMSEIWIFNKCLPDLPAK